MSERSYHGATLINTESNGGMVTTITLSVYCVKGHLDMSFHLTYVKGFKFYDIDFVKIPFSIISNLFISVAMICFALYLKKIILLKI